MKLNITKHIRIKDNCIEVNSNTDFFASEEITFKDFSKACYKHYQLKHSKFYKMDKLCKLGFLASELLLSDGEISSYKSEDIALILANASSSLNNDSDYQQTINDVPSPAVFVYTLPNIVIGEICIKNNIKGEAAFLVQKEFDIPFTNNYVTTLMKSGVAEVCITGWVEIDREDNYNASLLLVEKDKDGIEFNESNTQNIFIK